MKKLDVTTGYLILICFFLSLCSCNKHEKLGLQVAKDELKGALFYKGGQKLFSGNLITTPEVAIAVAEPILFSIYGKEQILDERPYEVYHLDEYWVLNGTLPVGSHGGGFLIILSAKDGRIIKLIHYK